MLLSITFQSIIIRSRYIRPNCYLWQVCYTEQCAEATVIWDAFSHDRTDLSGTFLLQFTASSLRNITLGCMVISLLLSEMGTLQSLSSVAIEEECRRSPSFFCLLRHQFAQVILVSEVMNVQMRLQKQLSAQQYPTWMALYSLIVLMCR